MEFTTKYVDSGSRWQRKHYAVVTLRVETPSLLIEDVDDAGVVNKANLEQHLFEGFVNGLGDLAETFKIILLKAIVHNTDSSKESFLRAGRQAAMKIHSEWK